MNVSDLLARLVPSGLEKIPTSDPTMRNDRIVRSVAQRNAEGSVLLGNGKLLTAKDKERAFAALDLD
jgi:hypothetical protein